MSKMRQDIQIRALARWFERQQRVLPWRENPSLYRVWISEIMLQQTQVVTVIPYFERFLERFPTLEALAKAELDDVVARWAGLGYYSRARNLHRAARRIRDLGDFPRDRAGWLEIPGVGEYTAGAILSIALNKPEAILDGNVERVLSRFACEGEKAKLWDFSRETVKAAHAAGIAPRILNQALMELGATLCSVKRPKCEACPLNQGCAAHARGREMDFPPKKKRKEWVRVEEEVHCVLDLHASRILLRQRAPGEWRAGLWDFPEKLPLSRSKLRWLGEIESRHVVTRHKIHRKTQVWLAGRGFKPKSESWERLPEPEVAVGSALRKTLAKILETFPEVARARSGPEAASGR